MTSLPRSIIAAVDFGEASSRAIAIAGEIAARCGASLTLLHAESLEAPAYFTAEQIDALARQRHALRAQAEQFLRAFGRRYTSTGFDVRIDDRAPIDAILHAAEAADLLVMGTHGRHGPKRWWLGSVAERVLRQTSRPLLVVRGDVSGTGLFDRPVLHTSGAFDQAGIAGYARALAECFGGQVADGSDDSVDSAVERTAATMAVIAAPEPRTADWLAHYGEPLIRYCKVPVLFVPAIPEGVMS
jgi:nucleotide-binding universal stress UspA family protein